MSDPVLSVRDLRVAFRTEDATVRAVRGLTFDLAPGEILGIVGESGSGKSAAAMALTALNRSANATLEGEVLLNGRNLLALPERQLRSVRGAEIAMIFQDPMTSLTPVYRVGALIGEVLRAHEPLSRSQARARAIELLEEVGIPDAAGRVDDYPHEFSGGMRQRVMIAMALACRPAVLIADEPTTALDVTIQAQILALMRTLQDETGTAIVLITHDLGVVAEVADDVVVMYAGRIVERAPVAALFADPQHPYTIGLLGSIPRLHVEQARLAAIEGQVPGPETTVHGCRFHPRCPFAVERCRREDPPLVEIVPGHAAACWRAPLA